MSHTPGPWLWDGSSVTNWHEPTETGQFEMEWIANTCRNNYPKEDADGRLIAAAPDLLDGCKQALEEVESYIEDAGGREAAVQGSILSDIVKLSDRLLAAIRKATVDEPKTNP